MLSETFLRRSTVQAAATSTHYKFTGCKKKAVMSKYSTELAGILVREFFGPATSTVVAVLFKNGRLPLQALSRQAHLPERMVLESLTVLIQHGLVRWANIEDGPAERTYYECFFEDIYPLVRYGKEIHLTEKHTGLAEAGSLVQYIMMQGRQKIKDIVAALTDADEIDHQSRTETLHKTLKTLLDQQYLRTVNWWNLMPNDDLLNKITLEEEKRLRGENTTSASMSTKTMKEAAAESERRIKELKSDDKMMEGLKRKADEMIDVATHLSLKRHKRAHEVDEAEEEIKLDVDENVSITVDHSKFAILVRNSELVWEVHKRLGPATAAVYQAALDTVQKKLKAQREEVSEIDVSTAEVALALPDPTKSPSFTDLVDPPSEISRSNFTNGISRPAKLGRRGYSSDEDDMPEVKINGIHRSPEDLLQKKMAIVAEHLHSLAEDSTLFIRPGNGSQTPSDEEKWTVNLFSIQQFLRQSELENLIERKYGGDALRLVRIIAEKSNVDQDQFEKLILLKNKELRSVLSALQTGGILEVQEIPKSAGTERAKNYNLWSFHESRARAFLLEDLYKTLIRIYQRIDEERSRKHGILAKAQRTDVKKDLRRYLSGDELKQYAEWRALEERLLGQIMRVDKSVMLLRDV